MMKPALTFAYPAYLAKYYPTKKSMRMLIPFSSGRCGSPIKPGLSPRLDRQERGGGR
jgi:hypothetical protein